MGFGKPRSLSGLSFVYLSRSGSPSSRTSRPPRGPAEGEDRPAASASERGHGPQSAASAASRLDLKEEPFSAVCCLSCCPAVAAWSGTPCSVCCDLAIEGVLSAGRGRPARTPFGGLGRALPVVASASKCGVRCLSLVGPRICWLVNGTRDIPVEALFPQCGERFELGSSRSSRVLGIDAVGGPPHCNFANEGAAQVACQWSPGRLGVTLAGVVFDLVGEVGD
jgi:hypothetical protein